MPFVMLQEIPPNFISLLDKLAYDLNGEDISIADVEAESFLADKANDAQVRAIYKLEAKDCKVFISSISIKRICQMFYLSINSSQ